MTTQTLSQIDVEAPADIALDAGPDTHDELSLLILDDDEVDRARLNRFAAQIGLPVNIRLASTLSEFNQALDNEVFDLAIVDYRLPDGDGLQALKAARAHPRNASAAMIMVAGDGRSGTAVAAMKNGCADFITKDNLSADILRSSIIDALAKSPLGNDASAAMIAASAQSMMLALKASCLNDIRPLMARILRLIRNVRSGALATAHEREEAIRDVEQSCLKLCTFLDAVDDNITNWPRQLN